MNTDKRDVVRKPGLAACAQRDSGALTPLLMVLLVGIVAVALVLVTGCASKTENKEGAQPTASEQAAPADKKEESKKDKKKAESAKPAELDKTVEYHGLVVPYSSQWNEYIDKDDTLYIDLAEDNFVTIQREDMSQYDLTDVDPQEFFQIFTEGFATGEGVLSAEATELAGKEYPTAEFHSEQKAGNYHLKCDGQLILVDTEYYIILHAYSVDAENKFIDEANRVIDGIQVKAQ